MLAQGVRRVALWGLTEITDLCQRVFQGMDGQIKVVGVVNTTGRHPSSEIPVYETGKQVHHQHPLTSP